jgi:hypothetical protein
VLAISLVLSINAAQTRKAEGRIRDRIKSVEELQAKAEASYIFKDVAGARTQLGEAKKQADSLTREKLLKSEVASLQQSLGVSQERINNVVAVPNQPLADFGQATGKTELTRLAQSGTTLYVMGDNGPLHSFSQPTKEIKTAQTPPTESGRVLSTATTSNGDVLLYTDKPTILQLDTAGGQISDVQVTAGSAWEKGLAIDTVQQNVFVLDPDQNQIWRHTRTLSSFNKGEPYFTGAVDLKGAVDVVTGAQVFVLKRDGAVLKFAGGNPENFSLKPAPAPQDKVVDARALALHSGTGNIYVADPKEKRVIEFNAAGDYSRQFRNDTFANISDIVVDEKTNALFILSGNKVFQVGI